MPNEALPGADPIPDPVDVQLADEWLRQRGLVDARPTPLLARPSVAVRSIPARPSSAVATMAR